jgi:hypothetical protein
MILKFFRLESCKPQPAGASRLDVCLDVGTESSQNDRVSERKMGGKGFSPFARRDETRQSP